MLGVTPSAAASSSSKNPLFSLAAMQTALDLPSRLVARTLATPADLTAALEAREASHGVIPFKPTFSADTLAPGTFFLESITDKFERVYARKA
ncbi:hypothetical protein B484DRAFT_460371 [Ochromonadaceae sp. CCMP2298]|nr:hypothetical protein B484DRAFT_460371 [Ochromonadaceae sp. CCMP2298]